MKTSLNALHHQTMDCLREMEFYKQELTILQNRLEEVASKNTSKDVMVQVEHFLNKFIMTKEQLDILVHDLNAEENNIERKVVELPHHVHQKIVDIDTKIKDRFKDFTTGFADMRLEFNSFLSKTF